MELLKVDSVEQALDKLAACMAGWPLEAGRVPLEAAQGLPLAQDVHTEEDIPGFARSTVDGYAVLAKDTAAATDSIPVFLKVAGKVEMGRLAGMTLTAGQCAAVPTGGMLPAGADAVVMVEYTEPFGASGMALSQSVAPGENVVQRGEDAAKGALLLPRGRRIGPAETGALAAAGVVRVPVYKPLRLAVLSTGDELVPPGQVPGPGQVRDINTHALVALARKNGFEVAHTAVLRDDEALLEAELRRAAHTCDIVAVSGGSSQGEKDATRAVIDRVASPGVFTHGLALKPGKPTILGVDDASRTLFAGLPGHPVSAMMVFELLFCRLWRRLTGTPEAPAIPAALAANVAASPGKLTSWPVRLEAGDTGYRARPIYGKSGLITTLAGADGYFTIPRNAEGLPAGSLVWVQLF